MEYEWNANTNGNLYVFRCWLEFGNVVMRVCDAFLHEQLVDRITYKSHLYFSRCDLFSFCVRVSTFPIRFVANCCCALVPCEAFASFVWRRVNEFALNRCWCQEINSHSHLLLCEQNCSLVFALVSRIGSISRCFRFVVFNTKGVQRSAKLKHSNELYHEWESETANLLNRFIWCLAAPERFTLCYPNWSGVRRPLVSAYKESKMGKRSICIRNTFVGVMDAQRKKWKDYISRQHHWWSVEATMSIFPMNG